MKRMLVGTILAAILSFMTIAESVAVTAVDPAAPAPLANQPILVSAVPFGDDTSFVELHNPQDKAVLLTGYSIKLAYRDGTSSLIDLPDAYLLGDSFMALSITDFISNADAYYDLEPHASILNSVSLVFPDGNEVVQLIIDGPTASKYTWLQRKTGESGLGSAQANMTQKESPVLPRGLGVYRLPLNGPAIRIIEVIPSHASCAPNDMSLVCKDYIKLFNPSDSPVDLSNFRLRSDSGTSVSGNAFSLPFTIPAKSYLTVTTRDDGDPLSLTNDGGYVWFEDAEGVVRYDETLINYPDASATTKVGWAWAIDSIDQVWKWTSTPRPDAANVITLPAEKVVLGTNSVPSECPVGKYRNPETNRCRNIEEAIATLTACEEGKERNPETNRCRSVAMLANATLTPCDEGEERNPATNRCRKVASAESSLQPCDKDEERNPATNRCRKVLASVVAAESESTAASTSSPSMYWLGGSVLLGAVGYGVYEWRTEIMRGIRRFIPGAK